MANWYGSARSNYFKVKDPEAFKAAMKPLEVEVWEGSDRGTLGDATGMFALGGADEYGGWPSSRWDEEADDSVEIYLQDIIAEHLADGEVAVLVEVGAEKLRYLTGSAVAFNNKGEERRVSIDDIFTLAKELGPNITAAAY